MTLPQCGPHKGGKKAKGEKKIWGRRQGKRAENSRREKGKLRGGKKPKKILTPTAHPRIPLSLFYFPLFHDPHWGGPPPPFFGTGGGGLVNHHRETGE